MPDIEAALLLADDEQLTDELLHRIHATPNPKWEEPFGDLAAKRSIKAIENVTSAPYVDGMPADDSEEVGGTLDDFDM